MMHMKQTNKTLRPCAKICASLLLTLLLLALAALPVFASDGEERSEIRWTENADGSITDGGRVLTPYSLLPGVKVDTRNEYFFDDETTDWSRSYFIASFREGDILWQRSSDVRTVFVTEASRARINALILGTDDGSCRQLVYKGREGITPETTEALIDMLANITVPTTADVDVTSLYNATRYEIRRYETSNVIYRVDALVFRFFDGDGTGFSDGQIGYLDLTTLDNSHFDANGDLSFRSGSVTLTVIDPDSEQGETFAGAFKNMTVLPSGSVWQSDDLYGDDIDDVFGEGGVIFFWITLVFFGFVLPVLPLVLGIVFAFTGKRKKRWLVLSALALVWLLCTLGLVIIL